MRKSGSAMIFYSSVLKLQFVYCIHLYSFFFSKFFTFVLYCDFFTAISYIQLYCAGCSLDQILIAFVHYASCSLLLFPTF